MRGDRHRLLTVAILAATATLVGAGFPAKDVSPEKWASSVCSALTEWSEALEIASEDFTESESPREAEGVLEDALDATKALVKVIKKAGIPDVDGGAPTARTLRAAFKDAQRLLAGAIDDVGDLPSDDDEFDEAVTAIDDELGEGFTTVGEDVAAAQRDADPELQTALEEEPDCSDIFGQGTGDTEPDSTEPDEETESDLP